MDLFSILAVDENYLDYSDQAIQERNPDSQFIPKEDGFYYLKDQENLEEDLFQWIEEIFNLFFLFCLI